MREIPIRRIGYWAAVAAAVETALFAAALAVGLAGIRAEMFSFFTCAFLPVTLIVLLAVLHEVTAPERRFFTRVSLALAGVYAVFCTAVYYLQLAVVRTNPQGLVPDAARLLVFTPGSALFAIDMLGYGFMCLAVLAAVPAVTGSARADRWLRGLMILKGAMALPTVLYPAIGVTSGPAPTDWLAINAGSLALLGWCAVYFPIAVLFAKRFVGGKPQTTGRRR